MQGVMGYLQTLRNGIKSNSNAVCIFQTFAPPVETLFGSLDRALPGTLQKPSSTASTANWRSLSLARAMCCWMWPAWRKRWASPTGITRSFGTWPSSPSPTNSSRSTPTTLPAPIAAIRGKSRKVLILDLDNTVWGGVIGDDGLEGIKIAQGDADGEAHLAVQRLALDLRQRGIVLAVSSKNTDEVAREPFEKHPEMLLKLDHIAVFQANWNDKATNIQAIAEELSLGLDAMVFLDDNPVERGLVRKLLPQVAVPELPEDPAYYATNARRGGYFEAVAFASRGSQARRLLPGQRQARQPAEAGWRRGCLSGFAGHDHHLPAL